MNDFLTNDDLTHRASEAGFLLKHPVLQEAFQNMEADAIERMLDDELDEGARESARQFIKAIRLVKDELEDYVLSKPRE